MSNTVGKANKVTIFVLNVLFAIISICAISAYSSMSFFSAHLNVTLSKEDIIQLIPTDQYPDVDLTSAIPDEGVKVEGLTIDIPADVLLDTNIGMIKK